MLLIYPEIDPVAFRIGIIQVHWYGLMYAIGFLMAWTLGSWRAKKSEQKWNKDSVSDLIFYAALGVIIGGRLGYMLFYAFPELIADPVSLFKIWQGGMSFHGGLLGVLIAFIYFAHTTNKTFFEVSDFAAPLVPLGLAAGRLGNFINGELWGAPTTVPWGMVFPQADDLPRHPSQLYELGMEGLLLFMILWWYSSVPRPVGRVSALFLIGYSVARMIAECFRQPDPQLGYLAFGWLTMGQLLCLPMLLAGVLIWVTAPLGAKLKR